MKVFRYIREWRAWVASEKKRLTEQRWNRIQAFIMDQTGKRLGYSDIAVIEEMARGGEPFNPF